MTSETFIKETKDLNGLILRRVFVKGVGWIEIPKKDSQIISSLINPISLYDFLERMKKEDVEKLIAFEVAGTDKNNKLVKKVFLLSESPSVLKSGSNPPEPTEEWQ